jgi:hypothetical protein
MTTEEKAKRYDEALERARECMKDGGISQNTIDYLCNIFPELAESKDEKIKEALIQLVKCNERSGYLVLNNVSTGSMISWLEKQGISYTSKDVVEAYLKGISDAKHEIEKQYKADYQIRKDIATFIFNYRGDIKDRAKWMDYLGIKVYAFEKEDEKPQGKSALDAVKEEKVDNQNCVKATDKVKPKFHEGDWVVQGCNILNIRCVGDKYYCFETVGGYIDDMLVSEIDSLYHLWTIADAEDGDVLYSKKHNLIWIYKDNKHYYASINLNYADVVSFDNEIVIPSDVCPANRVQKSILFQKMEEAGYEWDAGKKKLKKIEENPFESDAVEKAIRKAGYEWSEDTHQLKRIESKFHEGDWITFYGGKPFKILKVESEQNGILDYLLVSQYGYVSYYNKKYVDENARLWTIQDAKPGDVLYCESCGIEYIIILKHINNYKTLDSYCRYNNIDGFAIDVPKVMAIRDNPKPATKEQRDTLFAKMKEAGYEWDANKKELQERR